MDNDYRGNVSLWKNAPKGDNKPYVKGNMVAHRDIKEGDNRHCFWLQDGKSDNYPILKGKISDRMKPDNPISASDSMKYRFEGALLENACVSAKRRQVSVTRTSATTLAWFASKFIGGRTKGRAPLFSGEV